MSMIELGFFLLCTAMAVVGWGIGSHFGVEWYYRAIAAVVGGFIPAFAIKLLLKSNARRLMKRPPYPICESGTCMWADYRAVRSDESGVEYVCKCGKRYKKSGQRFLRLLDNGQVLPYKRLGAEHRWEDDMQG